MKSLSIFGLIFTCGIAGGMLPLGFGIIRDEFPSEKVAGAVGILAALTAVGGSLGIVLAGPIVDALGWRWLFWLPGILTAIAAVGAVLFVPQSLSRSPGTISWLPAILLSGHLQGPGAILVYRVEDYAATVGRLREQDVTVHELEIPHGPCATFTMEGQRYAVYELTRPDAVHLCDGRIDP